jgi:hypothetical protein
MTIQSRLSINSNRRLQEVVNATSPATRTQLQSCVGRFSQRTSLVSSSLEKLGVYRRRTVRYYHVEPEEKEGYTTSYRKETVSEAEEISVLWKMIGYGLTLTCRSYGSILLSLSIYPVVNGYHFDLLWSIYQGSTRDFQKKFSSGVFYPFLRNSVGETLLHVSVLWRLNNQDHAFNSHFSMLHYTRDQICVNYSKTTV